MDELAKLEDQLAALEAQSYLTITNPQEEYTMLAFICLLLGLLAGWFAGCTITMINVAEHPDEAVAMAQSILENYK